MTNRGRIREGDKRQTSLQGERDPIIRPTLTSILSLQGEADAKRR
jgi:hypothetical protein